MAETIKIGGELESVATGGIVAAASAIKDKTKNKTQEQVNAETDETLAAHSSAISGFEGGNFVTLVATDADADIAAVFTRLSVTPAVNTIYRIANWKYDATTKYNTAYYSEYAANGTTTADLVPISVENKGIDDVPTAESENLIKSGGVQNELALGAVYDVSAKNPTAGPNNDGKFTLEYILDQNNVNTLIPIAVRKGGMSIKFVQSSDNKYVQFRCMANEFTTDVAQWQGATDEPTDDSQDLLTSGGAAAIYGRLVQDSKYIHVLIDKDERFLAAIDEDGNFLLGKLPPQIVTYIQNIASKKVDEVTGKALIDELFSNIISSTTSEQYVDISTDKYERLIEAIHNNGDKEFFTNLILGKKLFLRGNSISGISSDKLIELMLSRNDAVIGQVEPDGTVFLPKFRTNSKVFDINTRSPRLIQMSDTHCKESAEVQNGVNNVQRMELLANMVLDHEKDGNYDAVIHTGDVCIGRVVNGVRDSNLTIFKNIVLPSIKSPFLPVVGNHDAYTDEEWYDAFNRPKQYSADLGSCYVIVLNVYQGSEEWTYYPSHPNAGEDGWVLTSYIINDGLTGNKDFKFTEVDNAFLEQELIKAKTLGKMPIVCLHTLDYTGSLNTSKASHSVTTCLRLLDIYGCKLILNGHSHVISNQKSGNQWRCNPGWFGVINDYTYNTSPWAINIFEQKNGMFDVSNVILAHDYVDTPRLGNVPASTTITEMWKDHNGRANYVY